MVDVALLLARIAGVPMATMTSGWSSTSSLREPGQLIRLVFREARLNHEVPAFGIANLAQSTVVSRPGRPVPEEERAPGDRTTRR